MAPPSVWEGAIMASGRRVPGLDIEAIFGKATERVVTMPFLA